jgi:hypothetical protein
LPIQRRVANDRSARNWVHTTDQTGNGEIGRCVIRVTGNIRLGVSRVGAAYDAAVGAVSVVYAAAHARPGATIVPTGGRAWVACLGICVCLRQYRCAKNKRTDSKKASNRVATNHNNLEFWSRGFMVAASGSDLFGQIIFIKKTLRISDLRLRNFESFVNVVS